MRHPNAELFSEPPPLDDLEDSTQPSYPSAFSNLTIYSNHNPQSGDRRGKDDWVPQDGDGDSETVGSDPRMSQGQSYRQYQTQEQMNQFPDNETTSPPISRSQSQSHHNLRGTPRERRSAAQSGQDYHHTYPQAQARAHTPREPPSRRAPPPAPPPSPPQEVDRDEARHLQDLKMLFPNHSEEELKRVLAETNYNIDDAITVIIGKDNLANAPSAEELLGDPNSPELIGALIITLCIIPR